MSNHDTARVAFAGTEATARVLGEIAAERVRQDAKWGDDFARIPSLPHAFIPGNADIACAVVGLPTESEAKARCERFHRAKDPCFALIAVEELAEAVAAPDDATRRGELVQTAAVIAKWIEAIDRRAEGSK